MRLAISSGTHGCHGMIRDLHEILSFNCWLANHPIQPRAVCCENHDRLFQNMPEFARQFRAGANYFVNTEDGDRWRVFLGFTAYAGIPEIGRTAEPAGIIRVVDL